MITVVVKNNDLVIPYTPGSDVDGGTLVFLTDYPAVTLEPMKAGVQGGVAVGAVIEGPRQTGATWTQGTVVYWDNANTRFTTTSTGNKRVGVVVGSDVSSSATRCLVLMDR
jgi:predicted RecA/RadA family phage recombinase